jgi:hypothetical protein
VPPSGVPAGGDKVEAAVDRWYVFPLGSSGILLGDLLAGAPSSLLPSARKQDDGWERDKERSEKALEIPGMRVRGAVTSFCCDGCSTAGVDTVPFSPSFCRCAHYAVTTGVSLRPLGFTRWWSKESVTSPVDHDVPEGRAGAPGPQEEPAILQVKNGL